MAKKAKFGPYVFPSRAMNALKAVGIKRPESLNEFTMTQLRAIPGFGDESMKQVAKFRRTFYPDGMPGEAEDVEEDFDLDGFDDFLEDAPQGAAFETPYHPRPQEPHEVPPVIHDPYAPAADQVQPAWTPPPEVKEPRRAIVTLTEGKDRLKATHFDWLENVTKGLIGDEQGKPIMNVQDLICLLIRSSYGNDSTRGGTRGVVPAGGKVPVNGVIGTVEQDFTPNVLGAVPTTHLQGQGFEQ